MTRLEDEPGRIAALRRYEILDTPSEEQFDSIIQLVKNLFNVPIVSISLVDVDRQWCKASEGLAETEIPRSIAFCDHTIRTKEVLAVEDASRDLRFADNPLVTGQAGVRCHLGAPLTSPDGYNVGTISIMGTEPRRFSRADQDVLKSFARLVVSQMELRLIAKRDSLTGALSRRGFDDAVAQSFSAFQREEKPASLAVLDLDHFKSINDRHGHPAGDAVLRAVVDTVSQLLRRTDVLGRIGGEEFGLLLRDTDVDAALPVVERLRQAIAEIRVPAAPDLPVTVSIGLAGCDGAYSHPDMWTAAADKALYAAKDGGRNQTICLA